MRASKLGADENEYHRWLLYTAATMNSLIISGLASNTHGYWALCAFAILVHAEYNGAGFGPPQSSAAPRRSTVGSGGVPCLLHE